MSNGPALRAPTLKKRNPLLKFTLQGQAAHLEEMAVAQQPLLGSFCLTGQSTVLCAPPNAGKTLLTLALIVEAIEAGRIAGEDVIYINADDTMQGIADKVRVLDEYRVHMVAQGYQGFKAAMLTPLLEQMIEEDTARGTFLIIDTFKKFTQPMSKRDTSEFTDVIRRFVLKGGTLLCLSHTNKTPDADGRNIFAGVSDIIDDTDCVFIIDVKSEPNQTRTATLRNIKRRGNTPDTVAYSYSADPKLSYIERLTSIVEVDPEDERVEDHNDGRVDDAEILHDLAKFIHYGSDIGKMALVRAASRKLAVSKRRVLKLLEQHVGTDDATHLWSYEVRARGRHAFVLLGPPPSP